jgi:glutamine synthetase
MPPPNDRYLTLESLRKRIESGDVDTVVLAFTDMQGRLQGKRLHGQYFLDVVVEHGTEGCNYLLAVDIDMNTVDGYAMSSWERGYGDMEFVPDWDTIRLLPHLPASALVQCDLVWLDHAPVIESPRTILKAQLDAFAERGLVALAGTELEFIAFNTSYEDAHRLGHRGLEPVNQYNVDYSILGTTRAEPLLRDIRNTMYAAGLDVEGAKGECNLGQHEIGFLYADALVTADNHSVYKTVAKEIAAERGQAITFMAKYNEREGSSCHIHLSLRGENGDVVFWEEGRRSAMYDAFVAGVLATMSEFTLLYAPNINSYKRFANGSFAPTAVAWGEDNRTCAVRLVGHGPSARMENRVPGGDVNPYLAIAAMLAGGRHGIDEGLELEPGLTGNAYHSDKPHVPHTLREARDVWAASSIARATFGDEVVDHYTNMADVELKAFDAAVTDWELNRSFERM